MFSSGDGGVGDGDPDPTTQTCFTNDGKNLTKFIPGFPASCPLYVFLFYFLSFLSLFSFIVLQSH